MLQLRVRCPLSASEVTDGPANESIACEMPLVSVIVPAYNAAKTIARTLQSVCAQTYRNIEVIVVDDGSTDETPEIAESMAQADHRIRLIRKDNGGSASARNCAIRAASGMFLAPIDADDLWHPDNLTKQLAALRATNFEAVLCFAASHTIDENDAVIGDSLWKNRPRPRANFIGFLNRNWLGNGSAAVMRRDAVVAVGGYDESLRSAEDWKLAMQLAAHGAIITIPDSLISYRITPNNKSLNRATLTACSIAAIESMEQQHPGVGRWRYWHAKSRIYVRMADHLMTHGSWRDAAGYLVKACAANPLWFANRSVVGLLIWRLPCHAAMSLAGPPKRSEAHGDR